MTASELLHLVEHTLLDTLPMVPALFVLYTALELLSHREGSRLLTRAGLPGAFGPIAGALLGVVPQCGMSVFMTSLFLGGRVSQGTLVATYLATSDEAIPVMLAHGDQWLTVVHVIGLKLAAGIVSGLVVDAIAAPRRVAHANPAPSPVGSRIQHHVENEMHRAPWSRAMLHSGRRTLEIVGWVFVITLLIGLAIESVGLAALTAHAERHPVLELLGAAVFGLIPNCSASIAIAEGYLRGVLSFGATMAGLCAGAGYGPILLFRRGMLGSAVRLLGICLAFSIVVGAFVSATIAAR